MDGRLLFVAGVFGIVFAAGVGHAVASGSVGPVSQVVDEAVEGGGVDPATPAADATERARTRDGGADGSDGASASAGGGDGSEGGDARSSDDGGTDDGSAAAGSGRTPDATEAAATDGSAGPPFRFEIERVERCGRTCRDVTATLVNGQDETATDLVVETAIYAGNDTDEGDRVWRGTERVGTLPADAEHTSTRRVDLGWGGGLAVQRADGWITVETTVETDDRSVTLERQREVA